MLRATYAYTNERFFCAAVAFAQQCMREREREHVKRPSVSQPSAAVLHHKSRMNTARRTPVVNPSLYLKRTLVLEAAEGDDLLAARVLVAAATAATGEFITTTGARITRPKSRLTPLCARHSG